MKSGLIKQIVLIIALIAIIGIGYLNLFPKNVVIHTTDFGANQKLLNLGREKQVKVLCWVLTGPNLLQRSISVKETWGKRCNKLLFMSSVADPAFPTIGLRNVSEGREHLKEKTSAAFKYLYDNHLADFDWFLKADDDTFVVMENLRNMLKNIDAKIPIVLGSRLNTVKPYPWQIYMGGGAGYVLSQEAVRRFGEQSHPNGNKCQESVSGAEDVQIAYCLQSLGVELGDSRDANGRHRFFQIELELIVNPAEKDKEDWFHFFDPFQQGIRGVSDTAISFHKISPDFMYVLEYFFYHFRLAGEQD